MKKGHLFTDEYFERQQEVIREIRLSERKFYQKVTDLYATAFDYDRNAQTTREFFALVQNKLHWAVHRHTAAEVIVARADAARQHMGLTSWESAPRGKIVKSDVSIAKNYLSTEELAYLERIVSLYLDFGELQALRKIPMSMADWAKRLDGFLEDFSPITNFVIFGFLLAVHESLPGKNLREILDHVRANPGKIAYGAGNSSSIVTMAHITEQAKLYMTMVPYKGESQGVVDLLSGRVQMMMLTPAVLPQALKDGKCRVVCVMLKNRLPLMPEVPTLEEAGVPLMDIALWGGFLAPAGTPPDIVGRLSRDLNTAMMDPDVKPKLEKFGLSVHGDSPEVFGRFLRDQAGAWKKAVALANIPIES
ncbi:MAG: RhuM family protein [Burkholderiaceae bacterium]